MINIINSVLALIAIAGMFVTMHVTPSYGANITIEGNDVYYTGDVTQGDAEDLMLSVEEAGLVNPTIYLDSTGGDAQEGFRLGYAIRELEMNTYVSRGSYCASACAIAFMAGMEKETQGILAFHVAWSPFDRATFSQGLHQGQQLGALQAYYFHYVGYTAQLQILISQLTTSDTFLVLSTEDLAAFEMVGGDFRHFVTIDAQWVSDRIAGPTRMLYLRGAQQDESQ